VVLNARAQSLLHMLAFNCQHLHTPTQLPLTTTAASYTAPAGTGQNMFGLNWGNGFITDYNIINSRGLSDPNPFFSTLVRKPYVGQVCVGTQRGP
jgi:hypothetical protein